uniref:Uncharacterized protein n=1 Tax=Panagrolaimus superbus TaxID=310955 RepID=A0A914ZBQ5_9BILA
MNYFDKPGINYCKKDKKTHRYFECKNRPNETVHKVVIGGETLSKKKKLKLYNSTNDNFMPGVNYSLNKARNWDTFKSSTNVLDNVASYDIEYYVAVIKSQKLCSGGGAYKSLALKKPNQETKFIEVKSGKGASFICLHNELSELVLKKKGQKVVKYSAGKKFQEIPSILFVVDERHPSDNAYESTIYRYKNKKWPEKQWHLKLNSICDDFGEEDTEIVDKDFDVPCTSNQTNLTFGDCFQTKTWNHWFFHTIKTQYVH